MRFSPTVNASTCLMMLHLKSNMLITRYQLEFSTSTKHPLIICMHCALALQHSLCALQMTGLPPLVAALQSSTSASRQLYGIAYDSDECVRIMVTHSMSQVELVGVFLSLADHTLTLAKLLSCGHVQGCLCLQKVASHSHYNSKYTIALQNRTASHPWR